MHGTIILDAEFQGLLPALDKETYRLLEENLLEHGCLSPLVLWEGILIDGHNRYRICTEHDIPFSTIDKEFDSRAEVLIWIISNQISRRNLTPLQLSHFRGLHHRADISLVTNKRGNNQHSGQKEVESQNETQPKIHSTATRLAEHYKVSRATINRDSALSKALDAIGEISPEAKRKLLSGEVAINKNKLNALSSMTPDELESLVAEIEEGTYKRRVPTLKATEEGSTADYNGTAGSDNNSGSTGSASSAENAGSTGSTAPDNNSGSHTAELQQLDVLISNITSDFNYVVQKIKSGEPSAAKTTLRSLIDSLENLYGRI